MTLFTRSVTEVKFGPTCTIHVELQNRRSRPSQIDNTIARKRRSLFSGLDGLDVVRKLAHQQCTLQDDLENFSGRVVKVVGLYSGRRPAVCFHHSAHDLYGAKAYGRLLLLRKPGVLGYPSLK